MMIDLKSLHKSFGKRVALHQLSLQVPRGHIYGLLGHNGAGKSTTIGLMLGHLSADAGEAWIGGVSVERERRRAIRRVGAIFEAPAFYNYLSGYRNLLILTQYSGQTPASRLDEVIELVGLGERIHEPVRRYSHGMRQRLALAQALLPDPTLLILDEPTDGLDPEGIHEMRNLVRRLNREYGLTILLSSHLLGEVEQLCHAVGILHEGHLLFSGDWRREAENSACLLRSPRATDAARFLRARGLADSAETVESASGESETDISLQLAEGITPEEVSAALIGNGIPLSAMVPGGISLERFYLEILQNKRKESSQ